MVTYHGTAKTFEHRNHKKQWRFHDSVSAV